MTSIATKRLWLRRTRMLNLFLSKVFIAPALFIWKPIGFVIELFREDKIIGFFVICFLITALLILYLFGFHGIYKSVVGEKFATAQQILEFRNKDTCHNGTVIRWAQHFSEPLRVRQLWEIEDKCEDFWKSEKAKQDQATAIK